MANNNKVIVAERFNGLKSWDYIHIEKERHTMVIPWFSIATAALTLMWCQQTQYRSARKLQKTKEKQHSEHSRHRSRVY
jgi:hypothetical protein